MAERLTSEVVDSSAQIGVNSTDNKSSSLSTPYSESSVETLDPTELSPEEYKEKLQEKLERVFSRENLATDSFIVSKMSSDLYVSISLIPEFKHIKGFCQDLDLITSVLESSEKVILDETKTKVKPNIVLQRNTLVLRDLALDITEQEIRDVFDKTCPPLVSIHPDVGNTWFLKFASEEAAITMQAYLREKTLRNLPIPARIKSETLLRGSFPTSQTTVPTTNGIHISPGMYPTYPWVPPPFQLPIDPYNGTKPFNGYDNSRQPRSTNRKSFNKKDNFRVNGQQPNYNPSTNEQGYLSSAKPETNGYKKTGYKGHKNKEGTRNFKEKYSNGLTNGATSTKGHSEAQMKKSLGIEFFPPLPSTDASTSTKKADSVYDIKSVTQAVKNLKLVQVLPNFSSQDSPGNESNANSTSNGVAKKNSKKVELDLNANPSPPPTQPTSSTNTDLQKGKEPFSYAKALKLKSSQLNSPLTT